MTPPITLFCCDGSPRLGAGHVTRCLALAEVLADAGKHVIFAVGPATLSTVPALETSGFEICILEGSAREPAALGEIVRGCADLLVVDHYECEQSFETACRAWARRVVVLDDNTGRHHDCDVLVDAAASNRAHYADHVPSHARILVGPAFALIRDAFVAQRKATLARRDGRPVRQILLSFGATDSKNATTTTLDTLGEIARDIGITVALSSNAPHLDDVRRRVGGHVSLALDPPDMAALMSTADLAIGAAGVTAYERAVLGLPTILVTAADNQKGICRMMTAAGAAIDGGCLDEEFPHRLKPLATEMLSDGAARERIGQAAAVLVDGRGAIRLFVAIADEKVTRTGVHVRLRLAEKIDEDWLLKLQSEPQTRKFSRNPAAPSPDEHHSWMNRILESRKSILVVVEANDTDVGMVRLDRREDHGLPRRYEISIAVSSACHDRGIGSAALSLIRSLQPQAVLDAEILSNNDASKRLFTRAGFAHVGKNLYRNLPKW